MKSRRSQPARGSSDAMSTPTCRARSMLGDAHPMPSHLGDLLRDLEGGLARLGPAGVVHSVRARVATARKPGGDLVNDLDWLAERFELQRGHLRGVAYRMLGSLAEADDAVQEA